MAERILCVVWCEECCNRHWELMNGLGEEGRAVSKSGSLKVAVQCESCRNEFVAGDEATAITIDGGGDYAPWEDRYLELDQDNSCGE